MFESKRQRVIPPPHFVRRVAWTIALSAGIAAIALAISVVAVTLVPVMHRVLHKFHMDETDLKK